MSRQSLVSSSATDDDDSLENHRRAFAHKYGHDSRGFYKLNLLSLNKKHLHKCELCCNIGRLACDRCRLAFYCTEEHFLSDRSFHLNICHQLKKVRQPDVFYPLRQMRDQAAQLKHIRMLELYESTLSKGLTYLQEGDYTNAVSSAATSIHFAKILHGDGEKLILPLLIACESFIYRGDLRIADGYLARCLRLELVDPNISHSTKAGIRRNEGLISLARENLQDAVDSFAEEVVENSEDYGPEHIMTSRGYYFMGHVFRKMKNFVICASLFRQTVQIWITFLDALLKKMEEENSGIPSLRKKKISLIDDMTKTQALSILKNCHKEQHMCVERKEEIQINVTKVDLIETCYALCILFYLTENKIELEKVCGGLEELVEKHKIQINTLPIYPKIMHIIKLAKRAFSRTQSAVNLFSGCSHTSRSDLSS